MRFQHPRSLSAKLLGVVLLTTLVALVVALAAMIGYDLRAYHQGWVADVTTQAELLGRATAPALAFDDVKVAEENLALLRYRPKVQAGAIYSANGTLFAQYAATPAQARFPKTAEPDATHVVGADLIVFKRVTDRGETLGTVYLRADYELFDRVRDYAGIAGVVLMVAMLVALGMSSWLQSIVTRPILAIGAVAREVMERRDYSRRAHKASDDEVGRLAESFNDMLSEIERRTQEIENASREIEREVAERRIAQQEIMRLNANLELRVQERTFELQTINAQLAVAKEAAEAANHAKSAFLSSMSHELRTPLNAILGFGELLASDALPATAEEKKEFVDHIVQAGRHLLTLINEILDLAQIESGKVALSVEPVSLTEIFDECRTMIEPMAAARGLRLAFPGALNMNVIADRTRLKQVLLNLLSNAIKYNRPHGYVSVECTVSQDQRVRIGVRDTGVGLRPDQLEALFQPFNRLGQEVGGEEGTGIGLVVTKRLVELMGGTIGVTSTVGAGSEFWVDLPWTEPVKPVAGSVGAPRVNAVPQVEADSRATVLYVEDNPANLRLIQEILRHRDDLKLISASDAHLGIEAARIHMPDVILMDLTLPGMSGSDAKAILANDPRTQHIPVIAVSANAMPRDISRGLAQGFFRYVVKPVEIGALNDALDSALALVASRRTAEK